MRIGRYEVIREIATGGMAQVYLVQAAGPEGFRARFALKQIRPQYAKDQEFARLFVNEARVSSLLNHRNIVRVFDFGQQDGSLYLVMEYVDGTDLRSLERKLRADGRDVGTDVACYVMASVLRALHYAHSMTDDQGRPLNLIHRDVSPHNVLLSRTGDVKLADFGIAKAVFTTVQTAHGLVRGKLSYLAPEQIRGQAVTQATDMFAAGIVFADLLGLLAHPEGSGKELVKRNASGKVLDPKAAREAPAGLTELLRRMTAPDPRHRPTARQALEALASGGWDRDRSLALADLVQELFPPRAAPETGNEEPQALPPEVGVSLESLPQDAILSIESRTGSPPAAPTAVDGPGPSEPGGVQPAPGPDGAPSPVPAASAGRPAPSPVPAPPVPGPVTAHDPVEPSVAPPGGPDGSILPEHGPRHPRAGGPPETPAPSAVQAEALPGTVPPPQGPSVPRPRNPGLAGRPFSARKWLTVGLALLAAGLTVLAVWLAWPKGGNGAPRIHSQEPEPAWAVLKLDARTGTLEVHLDGVPLGPGLVRLRVRPGTHRIAFGKAGAGKPCGQWTGTVEEGEEVSVPLPAGCVEARP